jgi:hypothetical protein
VALFSDTGHDNAGHVGDTPYFDVTVDCNMCHNIELPQIHGNDCATCHPTPYDSIRRIWEKGCQQGGCHETFHDDSTTAHSDFEDPGDLENDCTLCHLTSDGGGVMSPGKCLNCHAAFTPGDLTPPVTTSNAQGVYTGPAKIEFSIKENGLVGIGRTFYKLDGGGVTAAGNYVLITAPGQHTLEFWSKDQYGNSELTPNTVSFSIFEDTTPPTTTSDAKSNYSNGAVITLTATDDGPLGVKATYYRLNGGPTQTGTSVVIPATNGIIPYTLIFWSEDWAGNIEAEHTVNFTVTSGSGTIRLVWGDSDTSGSPCPGDADAWAQWTIFQTGSPTKSGSQGCPNWSGVNDITVAPGPTPLTVLVDYWDSSLYDGEGDFTQIRFTNVTLTTPGQVVVLRY